jgi:hypothetical protein
MMPLKQTAVVRFQHQDIREALMRMAHQMGYDVPENASVDMTLTPSANYPGRPNATAALEWEIVATPKQP